MEQYHDKLIAQLIEIDDGLEKNSSELTLDTIRQTKQKLYSIILRLKNIHNSKLPIHRLVPCILYNIFISAVYDSPSDYIRPETTALSISHVCRRWREAVLGWPVLWGFVTLDNPPSIVELFVNRSKNAPLTLSWTIEEPLAPPLEETSGFNPSTRLYLKSCANSILPRLYSLTLDFPQSEFTLIRDVFCTSGPLPLLYLRYLDIHVDWIGWDRAALSLEDFLRIDVSFLRQLRLSHLDWPWLKLPHHNLTSIIIYYPNTLPSLSALLFFLSSCPLLREFEYHIRDIRSTTTTITPITTSSTNVSINRLNFPNLERLILTSDGPSSYYDYIREISTRIGNLGRLSQFRLVYKGCIIQSYNVFESVPFGTLSHFPDHSFLSISTYTGSDFEVITTPNGESSFSEITSSSFAVTSAPNGSFGLFDEPLFISGQTRCSLFIEESPIFKLIHEMPQLVHLVLWNGAWKFLTMCKTHDAFLSLQILEIRHPGNNDEALRSLRNGLKIGTLILGLGVISEISFEILLDVVSKTGVEVLDLGKSFCNRDEPEFANAVATLRERGIDVITVYPNDVDPPRIDYN